jgi:hypothetical protein
MKYLLVSAIICINIACQSQEKNEPISRNTEKMIEIDQVPFSKNNWQQTPHVKGRVATDNDVKERKAVFVINPKKGIHKSIDIQIPSLAYHINQETKEKTLVVVIQAEECDNQKVAGVRYTDGSEGACLLYELEFIDNYPD